MLLLHADCYMVAGGLVRRDETRHAEVCTDVDPLHAHKVVNFAKVGGRCHQATGSGAWQGTYVCA